MPSVGIAPTKAELGRQRSRLEVAARVHGLLEERRDEIVRFLEDVDGRCGDMRGKMETVRDGAAETLAIVSALMSPQELEQALLLRRVAEDGVQGLSELDGAYSQLSALAELQADFEDYDKQVLLVKAELERLDRRLNLLEFVVIPEAEYNIRYISRRLRGNWRLY